MKMSNICGNCKHWHQWVSAKQPYAIRLRLGDCDKIPKGQKYADGKYEYDGYSFEDECYDDEFNCFELKEQK